MTLQKRPPDIAIVDFQMGNLFSVRQACEAAGMSAIITADKREVLDAKTVILPGVGAFGDAMATLRSFDLISVLRDVATSGKPLVGICLGLQLLMTQSEEFGDHKGLGLIAGSVVRLPERTGSGAALKVPHVGWNTIAAARSWHGTPLAGVPPGAHMYFVHSYSVVPESSDIVLSTSTYGDTTFCSAVAVNNVFACQFHPERSGPIGLRVYDAIRAALEFAPERTNADVGI